MKHSLNYGISLFETLLDEQVSPRAIKPETSLEAKRTKLKLSYFQPIIRRQGSWEKIILERKIEGSRERGTPNLWGTGSMKEAVGMSPQGLSRLLRTGHCDHYSFTGSPGVRADFRAYNTHNGFISHWDWNWFPNAVPTHSCSQCGSPLCLTASHTQWLCPLWELLTLCRLPLQSSCLGPWGWLLLTTLGQFTHQFTSELCLLILVILSLSLFCVLLCGYHYLYLQQWPCCLFFCLNITRLLAMWRQGLHLVFSMLDPRLELVPGT